MIGRTNSIGSTGLPTQEKTVSFTENGSFEILPDSGFALSKVTANVNVPNIVGTGNIRARFYCCDGTIIKYQRLNKGDTPIAPIVTSPDSRLVFSGWNKTIGAIYEDTEYGAIFNTVDGATYVQINTNNPTLDATITADFLFTKIANSTLTVEWGDGTTSTDTSADTSVTLTKTYTSSQFYWMRITCNNTFSLGNSSVPFCSNATFVRKVYFGANTTIINTGVFSQSMIDTVSIPEGITDIEGYAFNSTSSLWHVNLPKSCNILRVNIFQNSAVRNVIFSDSVFTQVGNTSAFQSCSCLVKLVVPSGITTLSSGFVRFTSSLQELIIPDTVTTMLSFTMQAQPALRLLKMKPIAPPIIANSVINEISNGCRIEVPQGSLNAYRTATNWSVRAGQIFEEE